MKVGCRLRVLALFIWTILTGNVRAKMDAYFTKMECVNHMPGLMQNVSCRLDRTSQISSSFSVEFTLANTLNGINGTYIFGIKRGSTVSNYTTLEINYCDALESIYSNYLMKMIADELRRASNFPFHCPFKRFAAEFRTIIKYIPFMILSFQNTPFYIKDYTIDTRVIPSYVPEINFVSDCTLKLHKRRCFN